MCAHYHSVSNPTKLRQYFDVDAPTDIAKSDVWPGYSSVFIRRHLHADVGDEAVPNREVVVGRFGLIPHWSKDDKISRHTYNARSETVMEKPSFRDAWRKAQHCIIPAAGIYEPDWRSGKAVTTRIETHTGEPLGIAGLWSAWRSPTGEIVSSFTMLTINADAHPLMRNFHRPEDEKRMVVILSPDYFDEWLSAKPEQSARFLMPYPADQLTVSTSASLD
jgi:putative SOS response-associated peptidase YedK